MGEVEVFVDSIRPVSDCLPASTVLRVSDKKGDVGKYTVGKKQTMDLQGTGTITINDISPSGVRLAIDVGRNVKIVRLAAAA